MSRKITIIGGGNLGLAITQGLIQSNYCKPGNITLTKRSIKTISFLTEQGVNVTSDNKKALQNADIVLICVKPFQCKDVLKELSGTFKKHQLIISVVTGISITEIEAVIGKKLTIFRAMPNTAIAVAQSMTCISYNNAGSRQTKQVIQLFDALGKTAIIEEKLMEASTVIGACGTAFAMRFIRAAIQGGIEIGFDAATAGLIVSQTVKGAAELLISNGSHPEEEIDKVTTPKGCTIAGLNEMEHNGLSSSIIKGITVSYNKIAKN